MSTDTNDTVENVPLAAPVTVHAAILARKSAVKQATSIERQIADARFFAAAKGWEVGPQHIYSIDDGVSGTLWSLDDRPDLKALLGAVQNGEVKHVVVQQLDRITRDPVLATVVFGTLGRYGVTIWCYSTNAFYDLSTPESVIMAQFVAYSGQFAALAVHRGQEA